MVASRQAGRSREFACEDRRLGSVSGLGPGERRSRLGDIALVTQRRRQARSEASGPYE